MRLTLESGQTLVINTELYLLILSSAVFAFLVLAGLKLVLDKLNFVNASDLRKLSNYQVGVGFLTVVSLLWLSLFNGFRIEDKPITIGDQYSNNPIEYTAPTPSQIDTANQKALSEERDVLSKKIEKQKLTQEQEYERLVDEALDDLKERWLGDEEGTENKNDD